MQHQRDTQGSQTNEIKRRGRKSILQLEVGRDVFDEESQTNTGQDSQDQSAAVQLIAADAQEQDGYIGGMPCHINSNVILVQSEAIQERSRQQIINLVKNTMYYGSFEGYVGDDKYDYELIPAVDVKSPVIHVQPLTIKSEPQIRISSSGQSNPVKVYVGGQPQNAQTQQIVKKLQPEKSASKPRRRTGRQIFEKMDNEQKQIGQSSQQSKKQLNSQTIQTQKATKISKKDKSEEKQFPKKQSQKKQIKQSQQAKQAQAGKQTNISGRAYILQIESEQSFKQFFNRPLPKGTLMQCQIRRHTQGFNNRYQMFLDDMRPLMCAQHQSSVTTNYHISMNRDTSRLSKYYLGKLRSNFTGSLYTLYNVGENPKSCSDEKKWRSTIANIQYETNFLGLKGPRKLKVHIPNNEVKDKYAQNIYQLDDDTNLQAVQNKYRNSVMVFQNKQPRWNQKLKSYALNFGGRVKQPSIKNFILVRRGPNNQKLDNVNCLIFGKISREKFNLEFTYPFTPLQAFGIALSSFDNKLNCQ